MSVMGAERTLSECIATSQFDPSRTCRGPTVRSANSGRADPLQARARLNQLGSAQTDKLFGLCLVVRQLTPFRMFARKLDG